MFIYILPRFVCFEKFQELQNKINVYSIPTYCISDENRLCFYGLTEKARLHGKILGLYIDPSFLV